MRFSLKNTIVCIVVLFMSVTTLTGCSSTDENSTSNNDIVEEKFIKEERFTQETMGDDKKLQDTILDNLNYGDNIYEYKIDEGVVSQLYTIELVVGENTKEEILSQLPENIEEYNVDWPSVIGKFAIGTTIIVVVGIIQISAKASSFATSAQTGGGSMIAYYTFAQQVNTKKVMLESITAGVLMSVIDVVSNRLEKGDLPDEAIRKYAIEGFADGYMWGAISSVLKVNKETSSTKKALEKIQESIGEIMKNGDVLDESGKVVGKLLKNSKGFYFVEEIAENTSKKGVGKGAIKVFNKLGKEVTGKAAQKILKNSANKLPVNSLLQCGSGTEAIKCYTDSNGTIYQVGNDLVKNITYELNGYKYTTDSLGRVVEAVADNLRLNTSERGKISDSLTMDVIGRGYELAGDERAHIFADKLCGSGSLGNMVAMNGNVNKSAYKKVENTLAKALINGNDVQEKIKMIYGRKSYRPDKFVIEYSINDGKKVVETILNSI